MTHENTAASAQSPAAPGRCALCGSALTPGWPRGLCPRCALDDALAPEDPLSLTSTSISDSDSGHEAVASHSPHSAPVHFGDYELLQEIARGGMGIVYKARQKSLDRIVALKMILSGQLAGKQEILRFRAEAEAAANLRHPNIVAIHETGEAEGQHYFSMEFVEGRNLAQLSAGNPLPPRQAAGYVRAIAEAIQYAHEQGILHRDLKPSNVLIDQHDQPHITDFGLAKRARGDFGLTLTGQILGSPGFMPPEQTAPHAGKVGPPSDVYGIGAILYHLLTGRPPFQAATVESVLMQLHSTDPIPPRTLNPSVPRDLDTICLKCLEKEPAKRYPSARSLALDLARFLRDEPVLARPASPPEKIWRWCRRKPLLASLILLLHLMGTLGLAGILWQWHRAEGIAARERLERHRAEAQAYASDMNVVAQALQANDLGRGLDLLQRHLPNPGAPDPRGWEWHYLWNQCRSDELATLGRHDHYVTAVRFTPSGLVLSASSDRTVILWNPSSRELLSTLQVEDRVKAFALSPDGLSLVTLGNQRGLQIWDLPTSKRRSEFPLPSLPFGGALAISPDSTLLAVATPPAEIQLRDFHTGTLRASLSGHTLPVRALLFAPEGNLLYSGAEDGTLRAWDLAHRRQLFLIDAHRDWISSLALSPAQPLLASASADGSIALWDLRSHQGLARLTNHASLVWDVKFSPDGRRLASCGADQRLRLWRAADGSEIRSLKGHSAEVWSLDFSPDGRTVVSAGKDQSVRLWDVDTPAPPPVEVHLPGYATIGSFAPDARHFSLVSQDSVSVWNTVSLQRERELSRDATGASVGTLGSNGAHVYLGYSNGEVRSFSIPELESRLTLASHNAPVLFLHLSETERYLASSGADGLVLVHDLAKGLTSATLHDQGHPLQAMTFSPDDSLLAASRADEDDVFIWDLRSGQRTQHLTGHKALVPGLRFSPDRQRLATASWDGTARLWDVSSGRLLATFRGHRLGINTVDFSPDGQRLVAGTGDGLLKFWNLEKGLEVLTLALPGSIDAVRFRPHDQALVAVSREVLHVYQFQSGP